MKKNKKILRNNEKEISLISLVITIIILLILAGVSINSFVGNNDSINQAQNAKNNSERKHYEEQIKLAIAEAKAKHRNTKIDDIINELISKDIIDNASQVNKTTGTITTNEPSYQINGTLDDYI